MVKRRKTARKTVRRTTKKRTTQKRKGKPFGGYTISFKGQKTTLEQVFGRSPIAPSMMTKKIWAHVKRRRLASK